MHSLVSSRRQTHVLAAAALAILAAASLTGCSNAGKTTCSEYAAKSYSDKQNTSKALLAEHDLEPNDVGNTVGLSQALDSFCGLSGGFQPGKASRNASTPLDEAVNWSAKRW
ncbi:hypothetical protein [Arthrobacter sp. LjRoot14]|uniref:hypothetical protein n=1 Tax=Arthrobacter sp. LjRoot14 TaxID=3342265 RepID=UPI003ECF57D9